jgi:hypothetical protein
LHGTPNQEPIILNEFPQSTFDLGNLYHPIPQEPPLEQAIESVLRMGLILQV